MPLFTRSGRNKIIMDILEELRRLPEDERLPFAEINSRKISDGYILAWVLLALQPHKCRAFADRYAHKIQNGYDLAKVASVLPENYKNKFITTHTDKIENGCDLTIVLSENPKDSRLYLASSQEHKIEDGFQLASVLSKLPKRKYGFAAHNKNKIENGHQLACVIIELPEDVRCSFALELLNTIKDRNQLAKVLHLLKTEDQKSFEKSYHRENKTSATPKKMHARLFEQSSDMHTTKKLKSILKAVH